MSEENESRFEKLKNANWKKKVDSFLLIKLPNMKCIIR